ncbi:MAG: hydroxysqualene dehydroxylase HpnE [Planctomycetota bacterium]
MTVPAGGGRRRALVLGGGVAGIAAALELADSGAEVSLLEQHGWLGGRVFSCADARLGAARDNGPHVMLGCYDAFRALLRRLGSEDAFVRAPALSVAYADAYGRWSALRLPSWPVPLAMPWAVLRMPGLGLGERLRALLGFAGTLLGARGSDSLEQWLARWRQHGGPRRFLWEPLCLAVMNAAPSRTSARLFLRTMRRAFLRGAARGAIWIPDRPWSAIVGEPALRALASSGVQVRLRCRVRGLDVERGRVCGLRVDDVATGASRLGVAPSDTVVSTLPWHRLAALLPDDEVAAGAACWRGAPIVSVYFALDADPPLPDAPLVALVDGDPFHFLVRRPSDPKRCFALLAGDAAGFDGASVHEIVARAGAQLTRHFPGVRVDPACARVVREARATLLIEPGSDAARPRCGPHPRVENLRLAGDWCATGLPSTLEGAAVSAALALATGAAGSRRGW